MKASVFLIFCFVSLTAMEAQDKQELTCVSKIVEVRNQGKSSPYLTDFLIVCRYKNETYSYVRPAGTIDYGDGKTGKVYSIIRDKVSDDNPNLMIYFDTGKNAEDKQFGFPYQSCGFLELWDYDGHVYAEPGKYKIRIEITFEYPHEYTEDDNHVIDYTNVFRVTEIYEEWITVE